jgi:hypothetical protein
MKRGNNSRAFFLQGIKFSNSIACFRLPEFYALLFQVLSGYRSVQSPENNSAIMDGVRKTYDGPLAVVHDLMVINVTKDIIKVRMATVDEYVLPPDVPDAYRKAPRTDKKITI